MKELFDKVDVDKSGVIEYGEFKQVCTRDRRGANTSVFEQRLRYVPRHSTYSLSLIFFMVLSQVELRGPVA